MGKQIIDWVKNLLSGFQGQPRQVEDLALDVEGDDIFKVLQQRPQMFLDGSLNLPLGRQQLRLGNLKRHYPHIILKSRRRFGRFTRAYQTIGIPMAYQSTKNTHIKVECRNPGV